MKMNRLTKAGILILVIGLSFLAGTLYRSTKEGGGGSLGSGFDGLAPDGWAPPKYASSAVYFQAPRDYQMNVKSNGTLDVYLLNSAGIRLWKGEGKLAPANSFEGITPQTVTFHLNSRDDYMVLVHNPSKEVATMYELSMSGYGIETDLLYVSLGIIVFGGIVTFVGLVPKGNRGKKRSTFTKSIGMPTVIAMLLILLLPIATCTAQSTSLLAPSWMKEGIYATYTFPFSQMHKDGSSYIVSQLMFLNNSFRDFRNATSATLRWECIRLDGDMATLNVSYTITSDLPSDNFYTSAIVNVNTASRSVYLQNGTLIGTTRMWMPSSPADGQEVMFWDSPPDRATANVSVSDNGENIVYKTPSQGGQRAFMLYNMVGKIDRQDSSTLNNLFVYEYDTGLFLYGMLQHEPLLKALEIYDTFQTAQFNSTNVDLGPQLTIIDWSYVLGVAAIAVSIVIITVLIVKRHRQRKSGSSKPDSNP